MTTDEPVWQTTIFGILVHPVTGELLLLNPTEGVFQLPHVIVDKPVWRSDIQTIGSTLRGIVPVPFNVLRYIAHYRNPTNRRITLAYLLEPREAALPEHPWASPESLVKPGMLPSELHPSYLVWLDELQSQVIPTHRPPWAMPGWYSQTEEWISSQLAALGLGPVQEIETIKSWGISCVTRVLTRANETFFFKASRPLPFFAEEGSITLTLAGLFPEFVTPPVAVDRERRWMLVARQGASLPWSPPVELHEAIYTMLARLQVASIPHVDTLRQAGCLDRRLPVLAKHLPGLLEDDISLARLKPEELTRLKAALPDFLQFISRLDELCFPDTLIHGDFHTGNIAARDDHHFIFDWSDASYGHPFMDLLTLGDQTNEAKRNRVRDAYLSVWQTLLPADTLLQAYDLAQVVYPLYHALSYQAIHQNLEPAARSELDMVPELLRLALQHLESYVGAAAG